MWGKKMYEVDSHMLSITITMRNLSQQVKKKTSETFYGELKSYTKFVNTL